MGKKESLKLNPELKAEQIDTSYSGGGGRVNSTKIVGIIKFILGIFLLFFVYSTSASFLSEFSSVERPLQAYFWSGAFSFLVFYLFIWEPSAIYTRGFRLLEIVFQFFRPLVRVAPYLVPIYTIIIFIAYGILSIAIKSRWLLEYCMFLSGFSIILHIVFSAKSIRSRKSDFLKANYIFGFSFIYIINICILAFCINLIFNKFCFIDFLNYSYRLANNAMAIFFRQLF